MTKKGSWFVLYLSVVIVIAACISTPASVVQQTVPSLQTTTPLAETQPAPPAQVMKPGTYNQKIRAGGVTRTYILHVPPSYGGMKALPLVLILHGFGGNAAGMVKLTGMNDKADQENFFVAYLNGTVATNASLDVTGSAWNNGLTPDLNLTVDDVAFVRDLVKHLEGQLYVDSHRIYAAGFSNGAMMAHRLGAELPDLLAGTAVVEGTIGIAQPDGTLYTIPNPVGPISIIIIHGKADTHVLYDGGQATEGAGKINAKSVADAVAFWTTADGCTGTPQQATMNNGNVIKTDYPTCAAGTEVLLYTIVNGAHEWATLQNREKFSATDAIWDFFSQHSHP